MKRAFFIPIFFFLTVALVAFLVLPKHQTLKRLTKELKIEKMNLRQQEFYFQQVEEVAEKLKDYEKPLVTINTALPPTPSLPTLLSYLQELSSQHGLLLESIAPSSAAVKAVKKEEVAFALKESSVRLTLLGSYFAFKEFLKQLEVSARLIEVKNIAIEAAEENLLSFSLTLTVHSY